MTDDPRDFDPPLRIQAADGTPIASLADWLRQAGPAGGATQWKEGRSAYELAHAWCGRAHGVDEPTDFQDLLLSTESTSSFVAGLGRPEAKLALDSFRGNTRNADLLLHGTAAAGRTLVTVEAKADEPFGRYVHDELQRVEDKKKSNLPRRVASLTRLIFGEGADASHLRYQLLHGLAATVLEAQRRRAEQAVFVVHEFRTPATSDGKREANHQDLRHFMAEFGKEYVVAGRLQRIDVAGAPDLPVFVGLVTTDRHPADANSPAATGEGPSSHLAYDGREPLRARSATTSG